MKTLLDWPPLPIPISLRLRQQAEADAGPQATAEDLYQRSLATQVVQYYLRLIAVPHRLDSLPSGPALYIEELGGYVACCVVSPNADKCKIPEADRNTSQTSPEKTRKGYLFIALSSPYHTAQILGFSPTATVSELPLSYLQPLSAFIAALDPSSVATPHTSTPRISIPRISAADWAKGLIAGWQRLNELPAALQPAPIALTPMRSAQARTTQARTTQPISEKNAAALIELLATTPDDMARWQAAERLVQIAPSPDENACFQMPAMSVRSLAESLNGLSVALLVGIVAKPDKTFLVGCRLYAVGDLQALPKTLRLQGVEESEAESNSTDEGDRTFCDLMPTTHGDPLEYLFTAEAGDCFSLNIHYQGDTAIHTFVLPPAEIQET